MSRYTHPLAHGPSTVLDREADGSRVGVAGGKGPLRRGEKDARAAATWGGDFLPSCPVRLLAISCFQIDITGGDDSFSLAIMKDGVCALELEAQTEDAPVNLTDEATFSDIVQVIAASREKAFQVVNTTLIDLYWEVGATISRKIEAAE